MQANKVEQLDEPLIPREPDALVPPAEPAEPESLSQKQINYARELVENRHKLETAPIEIVWPFLKYTCCCLLKKRKPSFKLGLKRALRHKLVMSTPKSDLRLEADPFLMLGYGMNSYFAVVVQLMIAMAIITVATLPLIGIYASYDDLAQLPGYSFNQYTLGNFGGADAFCSQSTFKSAEMAIPVKCNSGVLSLDVVSEKTGDKIFDVGIIPSSAKLTTYCTAESFKDPANCSDYLDKTAISSFLTTECVGKKSCTLTGLSSYLLTQRAGFNAKQCNAADSLIYLQMGCQIADELLLTRQEKGLFIGCVAVFVALFLINYIDYIAKIQEANYIEWDVKTITAGDYAVEFDIDVTFFQDYLDQEREAWTAKCEAEGRVFLSRVQSFQAWIQNEMEERLTRMPDLGYEDEPVEKVKIAVTTLAFKNADMINLLKKRGDCIKNMKWDEQRKIEKEINDLKDAKFDELITPCSVFMTFEDEEGVNRAKSYDEAIENDESLADCKYWLKTHEIEIQDASEPSDIIWENRHFTPWQRTKKEIIVWSFLALMLLGSFCLIFFFSQMSAALIDKYPYMSSEDCQSLIGYGDEAMMQKQALMEFKSNDNLEKQGQDVSYAGYVQCFCDDKELDGELPGAKYGSDKVNMCQAYKDSYMPTQITTNGITVIIIVVNVILKKTTIGLITWIGYDTFSELMTRITNGVFIVLFFNTGLLLLLVNANLSEVHILSSIFDGKYFDYSPQWYAAVGSVLVQTMLTNAFMPPIFESIDNALKWFGQARDAKKWGCCGSKYDRIYSTQTKQIYELLDLYNGNSYIMHFKFSNILNVTYVTMMYGVGLPALFPIAFLSYFIFWATERYQIAYAYQLPPAMDDKMTQNAMRLFAYTPILFLMNGYWMLSNRQMFENIVNQKSYSTQQMESSHGWSTLGDFDHAVPMLVLSFALFILTFLKAFFMDTLTSWGFAISSSEIEVDENLPNFFEAVKLADADWFVKESNYLKEKYSFTFGDQKVVSKMDDCPVPKKPVAGIAWYNMLANPDYVRAFNYYTVSLPDRSDYIVDDDSDEENDCEQSDMVSILINLAYVKMEVARTFRFEPGYSNTFGAEIAKAKSIYDSTVNIK